MEKLKALADKLGLWFLKSFRGLVCEKKDGGWELSKGAVMAWLAFWKLSELVTDGSLPPELYTYMFAALMGYNGFKMVDVKGAVSAFRK